MYTHGYFVSKSHRSMRIPAIVLFLSLLIPLLTLSDSVCDLSERGINVSKIILYGSYFLLFLDFIFYTEAERSGLYLIDGNLFAKKPFLQRKKVSISDISAIKIIPTAGRNGRLFYTRYERGVGGCLLYSMVLLSKIPEHLEQYSTDWELIADSREFVVDYAIYDKRFISEIVEMNPNIAVFQGDSDDSHVFKDRFKRKSGR